jgi:hypothetical protein
VTRFRIQVAIGAVHGDAAVPRDEQHGSRVDGIKAIPYDRVDLCQASGREAGRGRAGAVQGI